MTRQKVHTLIHGISRKKKTVDFHFFLMHDINFWIVLALQLAHGAGLRAQELLLTPSELRDTVSRSWKPLIFHQNPVSHPIVISLGFSWRSGLVKFEGRYLGAQMEFGGVLWCKVRVFYPTKMVGWTGDSSEHSETRHTKKIYFHPLSSKWADIRNELSVGSLEHD